MPIDYTELFQAIGSVIKQITVLEGYYTDLDTQYTDIKATLDTGNFSSQLNDLAGMVENRKYTVLSWIQELRQKTTEILLDRVNVREKLGVGDSSDIQSVLGKLIEDMIDEGENVLNNTVSFDTPVRSVNNANAGVAGVKARLDGVTPPHVTYGKNLNYAGLVSELVEQDIMWLVCESDSFAGGTKGQETFSLKGRPRKIDPFSWETWGTGTCYSSVYPVQSQSVLDLDFDTFNDDDLPVGWDIDAGAGNVVMSNTNGVSSRTESLELTGDSATEVVISIDATALEAGKAYVMGIWIKDVNGLSAGTITMELVGTGATFDTGEKVIVAHSDLTAGAWVMCATVVTVPVEKPSNLKLQITMSADTDDLVLLSYGGIAPPIYWDGVAFYVFDGDDAFVRGDNFLLKPLNDNASAFQTFFRRAFGVQLPSDGTPTIDDAWAL